MQMDFRLILDALIGLDNGLSPGPRQPFSEPMLDYYSLGP